MKRITVLDVSSLLHASKHAIGKKKKLSHGQQYTFVIFGFLFKLRSVLIHSRPDIVVFALDSTSSIRKDKLYRQYKGNRDDSKKTEEQKQLDALSRPQFRVVKEEIIPRLGYKNIFETEGFEADDIIGSICKKYKDCEICIVSSDSDMYQLITPSIVVMNPKDYRYMNMFSFTGKYGLEHPRLWKRVKVFGGCKSDNVKGIIIPKDNKPKKLKPGQIEKPKKTRRIGEISAINYLKGKLKPTSTFYKAFSHPMNKKLINLNKNLVILPLFGTPEFKIVEDNNLSRQALIEICHKFGFKSILEDINDFSKTLRLK